MSLGNEHAQAEYFPYEVRYVHGTPTLPANQKAGRTIRYGRYKQLVIPLPLLKARGLLCCGKLLGRSLAEKKHAYFVLQTTHIQTPPHNDITTCTVTKLGARSSKCEVVHEYLDNVTSP